MLTSLELKFGSSPGQPRLSLPTPPSITIFVGPNNSGKSPVLTELASFCSTGQKNAANLILDTLSFAGSDTATAEADLLALTDTSKAGEHLNEQHVFLNLGRGRTQVHKPSYILARTNPDSNPSGFAQWYASEHTLNLDGPSRINLVNAKARGNLSDPGTALARLFRNDPGLTAEALHL